MMKMNYFELFQLPVQLKPDKEAVRRKYFELSKKTHPDYFAPASEEEQQRALDSTANLNKAFKTFNNTDDTIRYVLQWKGLLSDEEKYNLPPSFLMQVMEINKEVAGLNFHPDPNKRMHIYKQLVELEKEIYEPVQNIIENYQEGVTTPQELLQVKDYYFKKKYLHRLAQQLEGKL